MAFDVSSSGVLTTFLEGFQPDRIRHVFTCEQCFAVARTIIATEAMGAIMTRVFEPATGPMGMPIFLRVDPRADRADRGDQADRGDAAGCCGGGNSQSATDEAPPASPESDDRPSADSDAASNHPAGKARDHAAG